MLLKINSDSFTSSETITAEQPFGIHSGLKKQTEMVGFCWVWIAGARWLSLQGSMLIVIAMERVWLTVEEIQFATEAISIMKEDYLKTVIGRERVWLTFEELQSATEAISPY